MFKDKYLDKGPKGTSLDKNVLEFFRNYEIKNLLKFKDKIHQ